MVHKALIGCVIVTAGTGENDWNNKQVKDWIDNASGTFERALTDETTHLVITKKLWTAAGPLVQDVIARKQKGQKIKVVSQDWLAASLQAKSKKKESPYKFTVPGSTGHEGGNGNSRSHLGLLKELYLENTNLSATQEMMNLKQQQLDDDLAKEQLAEREREFLKHIQASMSVPEQAAIFKKGVQKAKVLLAGNHHIYQDATGFYVDVMLTKVDTKNNTNERYNLTIQIFESNSTPHTYAFTTSFSGTRVLPVIHTIVGIGSNLPTAFRAFRNTFKEKTGIEWNDRFKAARERTLREQELKDAKKLGMVAGPQTTDDIRSQKFQYYPPVYGPIGELGGALLSTAPSQQQQQEEDRTGERFNDAPQQPRSAPRSETLVRADFDSHDLARFNEFQTVENEAGEKLDPMAEPYEFGRSKNFEELLGYAANGGESTLWAAQDLLHPEHNHGPIETPNSVPGKRKDSRVEAEEKAAKRQKFVPEAGEYIIDYGFDDEDAA